MHSKQKGNARPAADVDQVRIAQELLSSILQESTKSLEDEEGRRPAFLRWELGACWVQHLQTEAAALKEKKELAAKDSSEGVNKAAVKSSSAASEKSQSAEECMQGAGNAAPELAVPAELMRHLSSCTLARLNESASLLQCKVRSLWRLLFLLDVNTTLLSSVALPRFLINYLSLIPSDFT